MKAKLAMQRLSIADLVGTWSGVNRLWLSPDEPARVSEATAHAELVALGRALSLRYTWAEGDEVQEGLLVIQTDREADAPGAIWIDSWHMGTSFMLCQRDPQAPPALVSVHGSYSAPPGPDWQWRIALHAESPDSFEVRMYNISPEGGETLTVEATYWRETTP